MIIFTVIWYLL